MTIKKPNATAVRHDQAPLTRYRTAAVARMLQMPAATLRIWERRYAVAAPATTPTGHRQYSAADVQRLAMLRQLTAVGHPIGSIASLDMLQLRAVAATHAAALTRVSEAKRPRHSAWKVAVIGSAAAHRVQRPGVQMRLGRALRVTAEFRQTADVRRSASGARCDALIVFVDGLQSSNLPEIRSAARALRAQRVAVVYSFASESVAHAFVAAGVSLLREPADDVRLADWLSLLASPPECAQGTAAKTKPAHGPLMSSAVPHPRRYDDAALADFAGLSSTIACECPRHVAEILVQLSHFEAYSDQCQHLSAADAALHAYLGQVTGAARSMFESALERVAIQEGLVLPDG